MNAADLKIWLDEPTLAAEHVPELFEWLNDDAVDNATVVEVLENCGPPVQSQADNLLAGLRSTDADVAYWSATLLGRSEKMAEANQVALLTLIQDERMEQAARQRGLWALQKVKQLTPETIETLKQIKTTDPRTQRLLSELVGQTV